MRPYILRVGLNARDVKLQEAISSYLRIVVKLDGWESGLQGTQCLDELYEVVARKVGKQTGFLAGLNSLQRQEVACFELAAEIAFQRDSRLLLSDFDSSEGGYAQHLCACMDAADFQSLRFWPPKTFQKGGRGFSLSGQTIIYNDQKGGACSISCKCA